MCLGGDRLPRTHATSTKLLRPLCVACLSVEDVALSAVVEGFRCGSGGLCMLVCIYAPTHARVSVAFLV